MVICVGVPDLDTAADLVRTLVAALNAEVVALGTEPLEVRIEGRRNAARALDVIEEWTATSGSYSVRVRIDEDSHVLSSPAAAADGR